MLDWIILLLAISAAVYGAKRIVRSIRSRCPSCDGRGWYEGTRMKEECRKCGGTGKLDPRLH